MGFGTLPMLRLLYKYSDDGVVLGGGLGTPSGRRRAGGDGGQLRISIGPYFYIKKGAQSADERAPPGTRGFRPARRGRDRGESRRDRGPRSRRGSKRPNRPCRGADRVAGPRLRGGCPERPERGSRVHRDGKSTR